VGAIHSIYDHFDLATTGVAQAVRGWIDDPDHRPDRHGKWVYDLADFGVTEDGVRERFPAPTSTTSRCWADSS
jgi:hypothetical protein